MALGAGNPLPFQVGGGPTDTEQAYGVIRRAVGEGGSASDDSGIEGLWRHSRAKGLEAASSAERRALLQAFPHLATDLLPYYERLLQIVPPTGATEAERTRVVAERYYERAVSATPDVEAELKRIDPRLRILEIPQNHAIVAQLGRAFEGRRPEEEGPDFNLMTGRKHVLYPMFSTELIVRVRFDLGYSGPPTLADEKVILRARSMLRRVLSSDVSFSISTGPWVVGETPIGLGEVL